MFTKCPILVSFFGKKIMVKIKSLKNAFIEFIWTKHFVQYTELHSDKGYQKCSTQVITMR
jgi:hypothetical protein